MPKQFISRFTNDRSGRGRKPAPGTEDLPETRRYWAAYEHIHSEYLARVQHLKPIMEVFRDQMSENLTRYPVNEWSSVSVIDFCRDQMTHCAMSTLLGPKVFELNTGFREAFWEFDDNVFMLTLGLPRWMNPAPYRVQDQFLSMVAKYVDAAWANFDWNGPDAEAYWEPHFGARVCRETAKWLRQEGFPDESIVGALATLVFAYVDTGPSDLSHPHTDVKQTELEHQCDDYVVHCRNHQRPIFTTSRTGRSRSVIFDQRQ